MVNVVMVPLDGSEFGEQALPMAAHVATDMHAGIELVRVVEVPPPYLPRGSRRSIPGSTRHSGRSGSATSSSWPSSCGAGCRSR
jgi:nucleotide-binding universal stress UspA family protein